MASNGIIKTIGLPVAAIVALSSAFFYIGHLSSRTSGMVDLVREHDATIKELVSKASQIERRVDDRYETIIEEVGKLKQVVTVLRREMETMRSNIDGLRKKVRAFALIDIITG